jgi:hypothetical protein
VCVTVYCENAKLRREEREKELSKIHNSTPMSPAYDSTCECTYYNT